MTTNTLVFRYVTTSSLVKMQTFRAILTSLASNLKMEAAVNRKAWRHTPQKSSNNTLGISFKYTTRYTIYNQSIKAFSGKYHQIHEIIMKLNKCNVKKASIALSTKWKYTEDTTKEQLKQVVDTKLKRNIADIYLEISVPAILGLMESWMRD